MGGGDAVAARSYSPEEERSGRSERGGEGGSGLAFELEKGRVSEGWAVCVTKREVSERPWICGTGGIKVASGKKNGSRGREVRRRRARDRMRNATPGKVGARETGELSAESTSRTLPRWGWTVSLSCGEQ